ncbi:MAG: NADPH-dependent FMN reductase [Pyrinomonadaceae bacterium]
MSNPVRILGIAGSLNRQSYNRALLRAATQIAPEGAAIDIFEIDGIPPFSEDDEQDPPEVMVGAADERFDTVGNLTDEETREYVRLLVQSLVDWMRRIGH